AKIKRAQGGAAAMAMLARGEVDVGLTFLSEMNEPGIDAVGPLPREISTPTGLVGFVSVHAKAPEAARALLQYLSSSEAAPGYVAGTVTAFTTPLVMTGTPFEERVWSALRRVPYGETTSYGELARAIGESTVAARAVGGANGRNRLAILIPCHRVIGKDRTLVGYGGGLWRKQRLLELENRQRRLV